MAIVAEGFPFGYRPGYLFHEADQCFAVAVAESLFAVIAASYVHVTTPQCTLSEVCMTAPSLAPLEAHTFGQGSLTLSLTFGTMQGHCLPVRPRAMPLQRFCGNV